MGLLSTPQVAGKLGISVARVQALIWSGRLPATKVGRDYVIEESDLRLVKNRKPGRPTNKKSRKNNKSQVKR